MLTALAALTLGLARANGETEAPPPPHTAATLPPPATSATPPTPPHTTATLPTRTTSATPPPPTRQPLCPPFMQGDGDTRIALSGMTMIRFERGKGSKTLPATREPHRSTWHIASSNTVYYRAACKYDDEIIGVRIDPTVSSCWMEQQGREVMTWCEGPP